MSDEHPGRRPPEVRGAGCTRGGPEATSAPGFMHPAPRTSVARNLECCRGHKAPGHGSGRSYHCRCGAMTVVGASESIRLERAKDASTVADMVESRHRTPDWPARED